MNFRISNTNCLSEYWDRPAQKIFKILCIVQAMQEQQVDIVELNLQNAIHTSFCRSISHLEYSFWKTVVIAFLRAKSRLRFQRILREFWELPWTKFLVSLIFALCSVKSRFSVMWMYVIPCIYKLAGFKPTSPRTPPRRGVQTTSLTALHRILMVSSLFLEDHNTR